MAYTKSPRPYKREWELEKKRNEKKARATRARARRKMDATSADKNGNGKADKREGKEYLNMSESLRDLSNKIGFEIEVSSICTICDSSYNSYRENKTSKRQYGFIWQ